MKDPKRANLNATHLLQDALDEEDPELAAAAIEQGADVNALWDDQTLLSAAVQIGNIELIRLLLSAGADPNRTHPDGTTALTWCGNAEITALLLDAGASARHECGKRVEFSSLHNAAGDGDTGQVLFLETFGGHVLQVGEQNLLESADARAEAAWSGALHELRSLGLVQQRDRKGEVFTVTRGGYSVADSLP